MEAKDFITMLSPAAIQDMGETGVPASLTLAQAALESGWGSSGLSQQSKNLFGIKDKRGRMYKTHEFIRGNWYTVNAPFAVYGTWYDSIHAHSQLLIKGTRDKPNRYHGCLWEQDYKKATQAIQDGGYATDPNYAKLLQGIIEQHNLTVFDSIVFEKINKKKGEILMALLDWQKELGDKAIDSLVKEGVINNPELHKQNLEQSVPSWLFFAIIDRVVNKK